MIIGDFATEFLPTFNFSIAFGSMPTRYILQSEAESIPLYAAKANSLKRHRSEAEFCLRLFPLLWCWLELAAFLYCNLS